MVIHKTLKGRVLESAGTPKRKGSVQAPAAGITAPRGDRVAANKAQVYCPHAEGLVPWALPNPSCLHTFELLNNNKGQEDSNVEISLWPGEPNSQRLEELL